jgi:hypothetical protein
MSSKKQWQAAQAQARRAQADPEQQPPEDGESGRDIWDQGDDAWQARQARAAEAKAAKERMRDTERGTWSSDLSSPAGVIRYG